MRKAIATVLVAGAAVAVVPGTAAGRTDRCGIKNDVYSHPCAKPKIHFKTPKARCVQAGPRYHLPKLTFVAEGGIRKIRIRMTNPPRLVWFHKFTAKHPRKQYRAKHIHVSTAGLSAGAHRIRITLTTAHHKSVGRTLRFAICKTTPAFTG